LDFEDDTFYSVGIFSPVGWPRQRKQHPEVRGNAVFFLVEKQRDRRPWAVFGPDCPLSEFFDPETDAEQKTRARDALYDHPTLAIPGEQIPLDSFLSEYELGLEVVAQAIRESDGRFQIIERKGESHVQRLIC